MAYDVFGNGRTALKANFGKYLEGVGVSTNYANTNPTLRIPTSTGAVRRAGRDPQRGPTPTATSCPDCDLQQPRQRRICGPPAATSAAPVSNTRWGQNVLTNNYDPNLLKGWGVRPSDWDFGASVQQQILPPDVGGGGLPPPLVPRLHGAGQHAGRRRRVRRSSASPRRAIRACRTAAATSCRASTTSIRRSSARSSTT